MTFVTLDERTNTTDHLPCLTAQVPLLMSMLIYILHNSCGRFYKAYDDLLEATGDIGRAAKITETARET